MKKYLSIKYWTLLLLSLQLFVFANCAYSKTVNTLYTKKPFVKLTEYYDYKCVHCRKMEAALDALSAQYPQLVIIRRPVPVIAPTSRQLASFMLAARTQSNGMLLHQRLMQPVLLPTFDEAKTQAMQLGMNVSNLMTKMMSVRIQHQLDVNIQSVAKLSPQGEIHLPTLVFRQCGGHGQVITLAGEQPYLLLSAIVKQLGGQHVQMAQYK